MRFFDPSGAEKTAVSLGFFDTPPLVAAERTRLALLGKTEDQWEMRVFDSDGKEIVTRSLGFLTSPPTFAAAGHGIVVAKQFEELE